MNEEFNEKYFHYLKSLVGRFGIMFDHERLLRNMHGVYFHNVVELDKNRMSDVYNYLREPIFSGELDDEGFDEIDVKEIGMMLPTVLEVLIAMSIRVIDYIGEDNEYGLSVSRFFWEMLDNLEWSKYSDSWFDCVDHFATDDNDPTVSGDGIVKQNILKFIMRERNFEGYPIPENRSPKTMDLWEQIMLYITYKYPV